MRIDKYIEENNLKNIELDVITKLIKIRNENMLSQRDLSVKTGIKQPVIANLESGKHSPMLSTLIKILTVCGYKIELKKQNK